jgi:hypothetical protein
MKTIIIFAALMLAGCSVSGPIIPASGSKSGFDGAVYSGQTTEINKPTTAEQFRVFNQGASSFVPVEANLNDAEERATRFCTQKNKVYRVVSETVSTPPHVLGNFPRAEIVFECVAKG